MKKIKYLIYAVIALAFYGCWSYHDNCGCSKKSGCMSLYAIIGNDTVATKSFCFNDSNQTKNFQDELMDSLISEGIYGVTIVEEEYDNYKITYFGQISEEEANLYKQQGYQCACSK